jgi:hypothetical protein
MAKAYDKVKVDGKTVDKRTAGAFAWSNKKFQRKYPRARLELAQGSYNAGGVAASAGTHDKGGVIDVRTVPLTAKQAKYALKCLKMGGFAAWMRDSRDGMDPHIHAIMLEHKNLAPDAAQQIPSYMQGRNGLRNNAKDRNPWRPKPLKKFNYKKGKPVRL